MLLLHQCNIMMLFIELSGDGEAYLSFDTFLFLFPFNQRCAALLYISVSGFPNASSIFHKNDDKVL